MAQWKTGLFNCFDDVPVCLLGTFVSCYLFGQNAEQITGEGKIGACFKYCCLSGCCAQCLVHKPQRATLRSAYGLEEKPGDLFTTCCCSGCANCQEQREMKLRGIAPGQRIPVASQPR